MSGQTFVKLTWDELAAENARLAKQLAEFRRIIRRVEALADGDLLVGPGELRVALGEWKS